MPIISALGKQRQVDLSEFEDSLVYSVSSRTAKATQRNPVLKTTTKTIQERLASVVRPLGALRDSVWFHMVTHPLP